MTYNVFSGTLNPTHFTSLQPAGKGCGIPLSKVGGQIKIRWG